MPIEKYLISDFLTSAVEVFCLLKEPLFLLHAIGSSRWPGFKSYVQKLHFQEQNKAAATFLSETEDTMALKED